jgi:hypothetical protein
VVRPVVLWLVGAVLLASAPASALPPVRVLTVGKFAHLRDRRGAGRDGAIFRVTRDPEFAALPSPLCPATSSIQVSAYPTATNRVEPQPATPGGAKLPCERWQQTKRGYRYRDPAGSVLGVRTVRMERKQLLVRIQGGDYRGIRGPVGYVQLQVTIGDVRWLARFHSFQKNAAASIISITPTLPAAQGERLFWQTLWGDADREQEARDTLADAIAQDPEDGRSLFLAGMIRLYRFGRLTTDYRAPTDAARAEVDAADGFLQAALPYLWNDRRPAGDSRVPGFVAANRYLRGVVHGIDAVEQEGLAQLDAAVAINPLFNAFDLIGVVPQVVSGTDPLYVEKILGVLDTTLSGENIDCVATQPEICGNDGFAPSNIPGSLTLFGDLYAKGGRDGAGGTPSDVDKAEMWYGVAAAFGAQWRFGALLPARVGKAAERRALHRDADPANDPAIIGLGAEACVSCHAR